MTFQAILLIPLRHMHVLWYNQKKMLLYSSYL